MKKLTFIIILLALSLTATARKKKQPVSTAPATQEQRLGREMAAKYRYFYIEAARQFNSEHFTEAFDLYRHCLQIDSCAAEAHFAVARFYHALKQDSVARYHYEKAAELDMQNGEYLETLGQFYLQQNEIAAATKLYEDVATKQPDRTELLEVLLQLYSHQKDYRNLLNTLNRIETAEGTSEPLTLSKMQAYSNLGDEEGAYNALNELIKAHPSDLNYQVMMGNWNLGHNRKEEALQTFLNVLKEEPDHAQAQMSLMDYYHSEGKEQLADSLLYQMLENPKTEPKTRISLMKQVIKANESSGGDSTRILNIFQHVLSYPQKTNEMAMMQVAYMEYMKMPDAEVRTALEKVLEITPEDTSARLKYIGILWNDTIDDKVIRECQKAIDYNPNEPAFYYYLGLAQYNNKHEEDALSTFRSGVAIQNPDTPPTLRADMFQIMGDLLHTLGKAEEAYEAYDSCLVYNPDNIPCLNNYAYYLSEEDKDLKRAEQMSYKTIKAEPNNGTYLDTYAWILYKLERYEEADIYMQQTLKALDIEEISDTILDHEKAIKAKLKQ